MTIDLDGYQRHQEDPCFRKYWKCPEYPQKMHDTCDKFLITLQLCTDIFDALSIINIFPPSELVSFLSCILRHQYGGRKTFPTTDDYDYANLNPHNGPYFDLNVCPNNTGLHYIYSIRCHFISVLLYNSSTIFFTFPSLINE